VNLRQLNRILWQTMLIPVVALIFVAGVLALQIRKAEIIVAQMQAASDNIATATRIGQLTVDEENGIRGFQLTSDSSFLQTYNAAQAPLQNDLVILHDNLARNGTDPHIVDELVLAHDTWRIAFAEPIIQSTRNGTDTRDPGLNLRAKQQMDHVSNLITRIIYDQQGKRSQIIETWREQVRRTLQILIALALVIGLAIGISARNRLHSVSDAFQVTLEAVRANAQLTYESEQRLRTMLTSIGEGIIVCDRHGKVELLNTVAERLTGWRLAEAMHEPIDKIFHLVNETTRVTLDPPGASFPQLPPQTRSGVVDSLADHPILIRRDGTEIPIEESEAPFTDRDGKLAGIVIAFRDITEQRRSQTALVATEKLAVAGRLAATLAHEIHNPLDAVINLLYLLRSGSTAEETTQFLDLASKELDRVAQISRAMLGMYRESKQPVAVNVQEMLDSILLLLDRQMRHAQVKLHAEFDTNAIVLGYPAELRQVFINLLTNAADASQANSIIKLHTEIVPRRRRASNVTPRPAGVEIKITDTGEGIAADTLPKLFQPFFTTKGEQGTGLGLWVSQGIIEKHNGTIDIQSSTDPNNHGTTITVFLPRGEAV
jgi:signal transduction histidine kinase/CHASE3 domain sensor protein